MSELIRLRNGSEVSPVLIRTTMLALRRLAAENPVAFYELVTACRDGQHVMFGNTGTVAMSLALVEGVDFSGRVEIHDAVRDIVLAAVEGDGLHMTLRSPEAGR